MKRPTLKTKCVAAAYAAPNQRIAEFSDEHGNGGLISIRSIDGRLVVDIYRTNGVEVRHETEASPALRFERNGYFFWQDSAGLWNVSKDRNTPPQNCAYASAEAIAKLKGIRL